MGWFTSLAASTITLSALACLQILDRLLTGKFPLIICIEMTAGIVILVVGNLVSSILLQMVGFILTGIGSGTFMYAIGRAMIGLGNFEAIISVFSGFAISAAICVAFEAMDRWLVGLFMIVISVASFPLARTMLAKDDPLSPSARLQRAELRTLVFVMFASALVLGLTFGILGGIQGRGTAISIGAEDYTVNRYLINLVICSIALLILLILGRNYIKGLVLFVIGAGAMIVASGLFDTDISIVIQIASSCLFTSLLWSFCGICASLRCDARIFAIGIALYQVGQILGAFIHSPLSLAGESLSKNVSLIAAFVLLAASTIMLANVNRLSGTSAEPKSDPRQQALHLASDHRLTEREAEIFALLADGKDVEDISNALFITQGTVRTHIKHLYAKLGVHSKKEALALVKANEPSAS